MHTTFTLLEFRDLKSPLLGMMIEQYILQICSNIDRESIWTLDSANICGTNVQRCKISEIFTKLYLICLCIDVIFPFFLDVIYNQKNLSFLIFHVIKNRFMIKKKSIIVLRKVAVISYLDAELPASNF